MWATVYVGFVMNVVPGDDIVEACGNRSSNGEDEFPFEGFCQQPQDFIALFAVWQVGSTRGAAVPHPRVWVLGLQHEKHQNKYTNTDQQLWRVFEDT